MLVGLGEERQSNEQCRHFPFFEMEIEIHSADKIYVFVGKKMCELLVNLRCVVTKVINK